MNTKNLIYKIALMSTLFILAACGESFLQQSPQGQLADDQINNKKGVEYLLIGANGLMNGNPSGTWRNYVAAPSQWLFGEVAADNAHKGSYKDDMVIMLKFDRLASLV